VRSRLVSLRLYLGWVNVNEYLTVRVEGEVWLHEVAHMSAKAFVTTSNGEKGSNVDGHQNYAVITHDVFGLSKA
jgi:hypothetical protein